MPFGDMKKELAGSPPIMPLALAGTYINRALQKIYDENEWSFQLSESGWLSPSLVNAGTITATILSTSIVGDATAAAAWVAVGATQLKQRQIRVLPYNLYSIIGFDGVNTLTLDRPWMEPDGALLKYMLYQAYYPVPVSDFKAWKSIRDFTNNSPINYWKYKQSDLAVMDPQRSVGPNPCYAVPFRKIAGVMMYELWPHPLNRLPYSLGFVRDGDLLVQLADQVQLPLTEGLVIWKAKELYYEWREAQKADSLVRGSGSDYKFLMGAARKEYDDRLKDIRAKDRNICDNFITRMQRNLGPRGDFYSGGRLSTGR